MRKRKCHTPTLCKQSSAKHPPRFSASTSQQHHNKSVAPHNDSARTNPICVKVLRTHGMYDTALKAILRSALVAKLLYSSSDAWCGVTDSELTLSSSVANYAATAQWIFQWMKSCVRHPTSSSSTRSSTRQQQTITQGRIQDIGNWGGGGCRKSWWARERCGGVVSSLDILGLKQKLPYAHMSAYCRTM